MTIKILMIFSMFIVGLVPRLGSVQSPSEIRIEFVHHHHEHEQNASEAGHEQQSEKHTHELVISSVVSNFIESRTTTLISFDLSDISYPKIQNDRLPLAGYPGSIFRPPIRS